MTRKSLDLVWGQHLGVEACQKNFKNLEIGIRYMLHKHRRAIPPNHAQTYGFLTFILSTINCTKEYIFYSIYTLQ